jgi:hypothetical protein
MVGRAVSSWRTPGLSLVPKVLASLACVAALTLAGGVGYWTLFAWRGSDGVIERVARRCKGAGISVESTLILYETGMGQRQGYRMDEQKSVPDFRYLPPEVRDEWQGIPALVPPQMIRLWGRHPEFTRRLVRALHHAGVPILAGTDALGAPFVIPGASLHREFALLRECGLRNDEVLWSATAAPAGFLGKGGDFGTVDIGKRADLLLLEGNPLEDLQWLRRPAGVMVRGVYLSRADLDRSLSALAPGR